MMRKQRTHASGRLKDRVGLGRISRLGGPLLGFMVMPLLAQPVAAQPTPLPGGGLEFLFKEAAFAPGNQPPDPRTGDYWLRAVISEAAIQVGSEVKSGVQISLQANLKDSPAAFIESVAFNLDPFAVASNLACVNTPGSICAGAASPTPDPSQWGYRFAENNVDLPNEANGFDFEVILPNSGSANRLTGSEQFIFTVEGLSVNAFNAVNQGSPNSLQGLFSAAKIQGYDGSATLLDGPGTPVPGPLPLLGAAAAFQASRRLRRRLKPSAAVAPRSVRSPV